MRIHVPFAVVGVGVISSSIRVVVETHSGGAPALTVQASLIQSWRSRVGSGVSHPFDRAGGCQDIPDELPHLPVGTLGKVGRNNKVP